jgi:Uma2 family endonuclease
MTIQLPDLESQTRFNVTRWTEILADTQLVKIPNRIETDRHGHIVMSPPPAFRHSRRQDHIIGLLHSLKSQGQTLPECPLSTADGVKAIDIARLEHTRPEVQADPLLLTRAAEICVEILSLSNTPAEIDEKRALYFDAGAAEVWICHLDGSMSFFLGPNRLASTSALCPNFPRSIP